MIYKDKIALVTGSNNGGLGTISALQLAEQGAKGIVLTGRSKTVETEKIIEEINKLGAEVVFIETDLKNPNECKTLIQKVDKHFGKIDGLVNSAGLTSRGTIENTSVELWDEHFAINVRAPFLLMQGCIMIMKREKIAGSIVNIITQTAHGGQPFLTPYAASKGALMNLTKNVAHSQKFNRIRVNAVMPGWMDTPGEHAIQKEFHKAPDNWLESAEAKQPMGKLIKPVELSGLITYLLSDSSGVITGSVIDYDQNVNGCYD
jgi:NAD(P)-dependent dehydrogenase (short-subunit alcohol dehydrogenase family)